MIEIDMVEASSFMLRIATSLQCCLVPPLIWKSLLFVYKVEIVKLAFEHPIEVQFEGSSVLPPHTPDSLRQIIDLPVLLQLVLILFVNI